MNVKLIFPSEKNKEDVLDFYREIEMAGSECIGKRNSNHYEAWLEEMRNRQAGTNLPEAYVRENFYLCYDEEKLIGVYSLKFELTDYLLHFGGHIGYAVRPSQRKKGYATAILAKGLQKAKELGFFRVLCICDEDNIASEKTILKNGGVFENALFDPEEDVKVKRFWIEL